MTDSKLLEMLKSIIPENQIEIDQKTLRIYSSDLWIKSLIDKKHNIEDIRLPLAVIHVENEDEIIKLLKFANEHKIGLIPYAGGTSVLGGTIVECGVRNAECGMVALIIDMKHLDKVIEINKDNGYVRVQSGIVGETLERILNREGFTLNHFPASMYASTVGGWLAMRSAGTLSTKYGKIEDMVLELKVIIPSGDKIEIRHFRHASAGIDLVALFLGSEGTLGFITEATLRIYPLPETRVFRAISFENLNDALESIHEIIRSGLRPALIRLYDETDTILTLTALGIEGEGLLMIIITDGKKEMAELEMKLSLEICTSHNGKLFDENIARYYWDHRYDVSYHQATIFHEQGFVDTIEVSSYWTELIPLYENIRKNLESLDLIVMAHFSHFYSEGACIYFTLISERPHEYEKELEIYMKMWNIVIETCFASNATMVHHHGIGIQRVRWFKKLLGENTYNLWKKIKENLDPNRIMNPGKLLDERILPEP